MSFIKQGALSALAVAAIVGAPAIVHAQGGLVPPEPVSQEPPAQGTNAIGEAVDGWAIVRYSVLANGTTSNVRVIEAVPPSLSKGPIQRAVEDWTFRPATNNGSAIDWHNGESVVSFGDDTLGEPSAAFDAAYEAILSLTEDQLYTQATAALQTLLNEQAIGRIELGQAVTHLATISVLQQNPHKALRYLRLVTDQRIGVLPLQSLFTALQVRFRQETTLGRVREALATHEIIAAGLDPNAEDPYGAVVDSLEQLWETEQFLAVPGQIDDAPWRFDIGRRYFYLDDIQGEVESLDIECDTRRLTIEFQPEADFQLPDSFGDCTLFVNGTPGTKFSYIGVLPTAE
jgi:hypothetical protein